MASRQGLSLSQKPTIRAKLSGQGALGIRLPLFPSAGITYTYSQVATGVLNPGAQACKVGALAH